MVEPRLQGAPVIAADIGGTKILAALFLPDGKLFAKATRPTQAAEGVNPVIDRLFSVADDLLKENGVKASQLGGIGIACAGGIDTNHGIVVTPSPNLPGWADVALGDIIHKKYNAKTVIINDASAAALGEHRFGSGRGVKNLVLLTLGTGIGGGIIIDDNLYLGAIGAAGELGHMTVEDNGPACGCGNRGCLEVMSSGAAIARDAVKRIRQGSKTSILTTVGGKMDSVTAEVVAEAARNGDVLARDVIARAAYYMGVGLVNIVNIFNPELIVLGGGMSALGDIFFEPGRKMVTQRAFSISSRAVKIVTAKLGNEAGVYGAAAFVMSH